jgi:murein L,D-transpeptidase YafK
MFEHSRVVALAMAVVLASLPAAAGPSGARLHVTQMRLSKSSHTLTLMDGDQPLASFVASLGPGGPGFKLREGDNVTPVGRYHVIGHQASKYRIFLRLDYPNAEDRARFAALKAAGKLPADARIGGDIGIHGTPQGHEYDAERASLEGQDWTAGCIGLQDDEIDRVAAWVRDGTIIEIED